MTKSKIWSLTEKKNRTTNRAYAKWRIEEDLYVPFSIIPLLQVVRLKLRSRQFSNLQIVVRAY
jgi:hypothetical protein